jgi:hypothetical protein
LNDAIKAAGDPTMTPERSVQGRHVLKKLHAPVKGARCDQLEI